MKILRGFVYTLVSIALLVALLLFGARFADGPIEIIAGGPFTSGEMVTGPEPDWSFVRDTQTVEFQLESPARSRTTWIIEHEGKIYIPCGYMTTTWGKIWKKWPIEAEKDGRAILRVDGKLYSRQLVRVKTGSALESVVRKLSRKYRIPATMEAVETDYLWVFEMAPRRQGV
ncbi:MAG: hypothetical protein O7F73_03435 [Gammaproteobacteria bacterium]|nr:hypothetical protein [Gammaproteobacteria bacterium]